MLEFQVVVICAGIGLCVRAIAGLNLLALFGAVSLVSLLMPSFLTSLSASPETSYQVADTLDLYAAALVEMLPSVVIGELMGFFIKDVLRLPKTIIDHIRTLL